VKDFQEIDGAYNEITLFSGGVYHIRGLGSAETPPPCQAFTAPFGVIRSRGLLQLSKN
jgi:hypothetical protein